MLLFKVFYLWDIINCFFLDSYFHVTWVAFPTETQTIASIAFLAWDPSSLRSLLNPDLDTPRNWYYPPFKPKPKKNIQEIDVVSVYNL